MKILGPLLAAILFAAPALGQPSPAPSTEESPPPEGPTVVYDQRTEIDIEEVRVAGETSKPAGSTVVGRTASTWRPLLAPKADFDAEIVGSVTAIR